VFDKVWTRKGMIVEETCKTMKLIPRQKEQNNLKLMWKHDTSSNNAKYYLPIYPIHLA
jgi:hypothetical protein